MHVKENKDTPPPARTKLAITVAKYSTRYWAVYVGDDLLAVTVYKKGAMAIRNTLLRLPLE